MQGERAEFAFIKIHLRKTAHRIFLFDFSLYYGTIDKRKITFAEKVSNVSKI